MKRLLLVGMTIWLVLLCFSGCAGKEKSLSDTKEPGDSRPSSSAADSEESKTHVHDLEDATCLVPQRCRLCGETFGEALGHEFSKATCTEPATCIRCGLTDGEALGHDFGEASCEKPATCTRCGEIRGEALGHEYTGGTSSTPATCSRCGKTRDLSEPGPKLSETCDAVLASGYDTQGNYYELVANETEDYSGTTIEIGIIKNNSWVLPMSSDMVFIGDDGLLKGHQGNFSGSIFDIPYYVEIKYIGCGCFSYSPANAIINTNTGAVYQGEYGRPIVNFGDHDPNGREDIVIVEGGYGEYLHAINTETMELVCELPFKSGGNPLKEFLPYSEGMFACLARSHFNNEAQGFYDLNGNKVIDLGKYTLTQLVWEGDEIYNANFQRDFAKREILVFDHGACTFTIRNDQGTLYCITINTLGEVIDSVEADFKLSTTYTSD